MAAVAAIKHTVSRHAEVGILVIALVLVAVFAASSEGKWANIYNCTAPSPLDSRLHYAAHGRFWSSQLWRAAAGLR